MPGVFRRLKQLLQRKHAAKDGPNSPKSFTPDFGSPPLAAGPPTTVGIAAFVDPSEAKAPDNSLSNARGYGVDGADPSPGTSVRHSPQTQRYEQSGHQPIDPARSGSRDGFSAGSATQPELSDKFGAMGIEEKARTPFDPSTDHRSRDSFGNVTSLTSHNSSPTRSSNQRNDAYRSDHAFGAIPSSTTSPRKSEDVAHDNRRFSIPRKPVADGAVDGRPLSVASSGVSPVHRGADTYVARPVSGNVMEPSGGEWKEAKHDRDNPAGPGYVPLEDSVDTTVHETMAPAVTHETVSRDVHEIRHEEIHREIHTYEIIDRELPILDIQYLPARHFTPGPNGELIEIADPTIHPSPVPAA
ncbi:hypothetical protein CAC42_4108 [Sphaceloma murrayae]|uniref:Uncharacterized protein n=1 Tax=Sphaceloma murrayae TaxID=2082308 RepID=A0A2K1QKH4_9PEZI|nr:hypothetical protein CAC42_4108 [Sphaceloma murrayae]